MVNNHAAEWLSKGFPWVYPAEVVAGDLGAPGTVRRLRAQDGRALGVGLTDLGRLAVRVMRSDDGPLDEAWLGAVVDRAWALREPSVWSEQTTCCRVLHGENDGLPGVRVDRWGAHATITLDGPALAPLLGPLERVLRDRLGLLSGHLCYRPDPRDEVSVDAFSPAPCRLWGDLGPEEDVDVLEDGLTLRVRPGDGPDTGAYMDMRDVRRWLSPHWPGRRVLNLFAYTAAFSVAALRGGAREVVTVDLSAAYLERARTNVEANGLPDERHQVWEEDSFKALDRLRRTGETFDVIVCDPPSFSHGPAGTWSAARDTPRLVAACARVLAPGGWLVFASNHGQTSPRKFRGMVHDGLRKARRDAQELAFLGTPPDFPAAIGFPEGHYLKVGVWRLI